MFARRAVLPTHPVSLRCDIPILELTPSHPAENNSPHFMCLREPILQPLSFQIHAGMGGGCTPLPLDEIDPIGTLAPCFKSFTRNTYGLPRTALQTKDLRQTYSISKLFRCNTYKKQGEGVMANHRPLGFDIQTSPSAPPVPNRTDASSLPHLYCRCAILPFLRSGDRPFLPPWRSS